MTAMPAHGRSQIKRQMGGTATEVHVAAVVAHKHMRQFADHIPQTLQLTIGAAKLHRRLEGCDYDDGQHHEGPVDDLQHADPQYQYVLHACARNEACLIKAQGAALKPTSAHRNVDLALVLLVGVLDVEAREEALRNCLLDDLEAGRDQRLGGDDGGCWERQQTQK